MPWQQYNPNPIGLEGIDCTVRALTKALDIPWEKAYTMLAVNGFILGDMPSATSVMNETLRRNGFSRAIIPNECPTCYNANDFMRDNAVGTFVLGFDGHVATIIDGILYDSWDSSLEIPHYYWYKDTRG